MSNALNKKEGWWSKRRKALALHQEVISLISDCHCIIQYGFERYTNDSEGRVRAGLMAERGGPLGALQKRFDKASPEAQKAAFNPSVLWELSMKRGHFYQRGGGIEDGFWGTIRSFSDYKTVRISPMGLACWVGSLPLAEWVYEKSQGYPSKESSPFLRQAFGGFEVISCSKTWQSTLPLRVQPVLLAMTAPTTALLHWALQKTEELDEVEAQLLMNVCSKSGPDIALIETALLRFNLRKEKLSLKNDKDAGMLKADQGLLTNTVSKPRRL